MRIFEHCGAPAGRMTYHRRRDRCVDELIGLCRGFLADGAIVVQEAQFLRDWVDRHVEFRDDFPYNIIYRRLHDALQDGVIDGDEEAALLDCIANLVGGEFAGDEVASLATTLPLDHPPPSIMFADRSFVVTGTFSFGPRRHVCEAIESRGGEVKQTLTRSVHYLVVGTVGSRDWIHSSYGRKIETAVDLRQQGVPIAIVSELAWQRCL